MASEPEWRSLNFYMNDIPTWELYKFANEFEKFIRSENGQIKFFFMGEVLHYKGHSSWLKSDKLEFSFRGFLTGWQSGREVMVEDIGMEGL